MAASAVRCFPEPNKKPTQNKTSITAQRKMFLRRLATGFTYVKTSRQFSTTISNQSKNHATVAPVNFDDVRTGLENKSLVYIDVRNQKELQTDGKIVGSFNIPLPEIVRAFTGKDDDFRNKYGFNKPDKNDATVVIGCLFSTRSTAAQEQLKQFGFNNIRVYTGGFDEWKTKGGPISKT